MAKLEIKDGHSTTNTEVKIGDLFEWVTSNTGDRCIYLGGSDLRIINGRTPFDTGQSWDTNHDQIARWLQSGTIKRLPVGTTLTITQE